MTDFDTFVTPIIQMALWTFGSGVVLGFIFGMVSTIFFNHN